MLLVDGSSAAMSGPWLVLVDSSSLSFAAVVSFLCSATRISAYSSFACPLLMAWLGFGLVLLLVLLFLLIVAARVSVRSSLSFSVPFSPGWGLEPWTSSYFSYFVSTVCFSGVVFEPWTSTLAFAPFALSISVGFEP